MKIKKKAIVMALLMVRTATGSLANAQTVNCKAQLVRTACGSGKIELLFDDTKGKFGFQNGDVACWNGEYRAEGSLERKPPTAPFYLEDTYQLSITDEETNQSVNFGHLVYDRMLKVARIEVNSQYRQQKTATHYDLICE